MSEEFNKGNIGRMIESNVQFGDINVTKISTNERTSFPFTASTTKLIFKVLF